MPPTISYARLSLVAIALALLAARAQASPIFLTGYDRNVRVQSSMGTRSLLTAGLQFVTGAVYDAGQKILSLGSIVSSAATRLLVEDGLNSLGLVAGVDYGSVDAALFTASNLSSYDAIAIASSFGGMPTRVELDGGIAGSGDLMAGINGVGVTAFTDCDQGSAACVADAAGSSPGSFGFAQISVTSAGAAAVRPASTPTVIRSDRR